MKMNQSAAERRLSDLGLGDVPIIAIRPTPAMVPADWFARWRKLTREFAMSLTDSIEELAFLNLPRDDFMKLIMGNGVPENLSIRFRVPLVWGGKLELDNMFMCRTFPHANNMDRFITEQSGADEIWLPNPAKKVYLPANSAAGGDGGNATEDRLSQIAAQIAASRGME